MIINPAWPGYCKIGSAISLPQRLSTYQTGSPFRDYEIAAAARFPDCRLAERVFERRLRGHRFGDTEWYLLHATDARQHLIKLSKDLNP